ncbi:hypothetical protein [Streptomyces sp. NBC_01237]|uniref:hypothetical protein n=1 Tax=Streptomyces sp. NBC_01237 TaxID=2903790 RepID=UPI002DDA8F3B|nr:hypothetical protein [Streptomyces sp. NBC_01237]WRZ77297.1 hypothetical protein OG251_37225 [Streptomyces sp. NBC_01237]
MRLFNPDIEAMTRRALHLALEDYARSSGREGARPGSLARHIHVSWTGDDRQMFALAEARRETGWHRPGLSSLHILSGCAGLYEALDYAQYLLHRTAARNDADALVFVTRSNDLSAIAHTRSPCPAPENEPRRVAFPGGLRGRSRCPRHRAHRLPWRGLGD